VLVRAEGPGVLFIVVNPLCVQSCVVLSVVEAQVGFSWRVVGVLGPEWRNLMGNQGRFRLMGPRGGIGALMVPGSIQVRGVWVQVSHRGVYSFVFAGGGLKLRKIRHVLTQSYHKGRTTRYLLEGFGKFGLWKGVSI